MVNRAYGHIEKNKCYHFVHKFYVIGACGLKLKYHSLTDLITQVSVEIIKYEYNLKLKESAFYC